MPRKVRKVPQPVYEGLLEQAVKGYVREPDMAKLVSHFFEVAGGERAVAKMLYAEFTAAGEGTLVRQRILDMIFRSTTRLNDRSGGDDDLANLTAEDIERELIATVESIDHGEEAAGEHPGPDLQEGGNAPDAPGSAQAAAGPAGDGP